MLRWTHAPRRRGALLRVGALVAGVVIQASSAQAQTVRVSVASGGAQADGSSTAPSISDTARHVAFLSRATNLVSGDTNSTDDVFVRDRDTDGDGVFDEPGAVSTERVSVASGGQQANGPSDSPFLGADGRYVVFVSSATNLAPAPPGGLPAARQIYRHDRVTGETRLVSVGAVQAAANADCAGPAVSRDGRFVVFTSPATNLVAQDPGHGGGVFLRDLQTGVLTRISPTLPESQPTTPPRSVSFRTGSVSISADGSRVAFSIVTESSYRTFYAEIGSIWLYEPRTGATQSAVVAGHFPTLSAEGRYLGFLDATPGGPFAASYGRGGLLDLVTGVASDVTSGSGPNPTSIAWSPGMRYAVYEARTPVPLIGDPSPTPVEPLLFDRVLTGSWVLPPGTRLGPLDRDGRFLAFASESGDLVLADTNNATDVFVTDLVALFDRDHDTLDDRWEETFGLNASQASGADGPTGDPDGDGVTNAEEMQRGTHPRGMRTRYLAEGATGSFFDTLLALVNPGATGASVGLRFQTDGGATFTRSLRMPPLSRRTVEAESVEGLEAAAFSTMIESDVDVVVDRRMSWDATGYGGHAETSVRAPSTTWFLAEGATGGEFDLFYLLQNAGVEESVAEISYLRPGGVAPIVRTYHLPPNSRTTIWVDGQDPALAATDVSAAITATRAIIVERAMYVGDARQPFRAGHASAGVTAPSSAWFFAEGATGSFFDLFLLLANPGPDAVPVDVRYNTADGLDLTKRYVLPARSRTTVWVDEEEFSGLGKVLSNAAVSMSVSSPGNSPIVAERAMWWPGGGLWQEGHDSAGATETGTLWALADGGVGGPRSVETYVLIANTSPFDAEVKVTAIIEDRAPVERTFTIGANRRFNVRLDEQFGLFAGSLHEAHVGVLVESQGATPAALVVERSMYWNANGVFWAAGTNALGTKLH